ncbi:unnamed protein product, partial [Ectocarpus sp. 13 AM-2016]
FRGLEWLCTTDIPVLWPERIVYVSLRDVDFYEGKILHLLKKTHGLFASAIGPLDTQDVDHLGIEQVMELPCRGLAATGNFGEDCTPLQLSFDTDAVDPMICRLRHH